MADEDDDYEQEFEAEEEDSAPLPTIDVSEREPLYASDSASSPFPPSAPSAQSHEILDTPSQAAVRDEPPKRAEPAAKKPIHSALGQSPWMYTVHAKRARALRIPVSSSSVAGTNTSTNMGIGGVPVIRDLRVFGVVDKQSMQSHGSRWKQDPRATASATGINSEASRSGRRAPSPSSSSRGAIPAPPRSGVMEEAYWRNKDGKLQWTFTMDRFRRLKAYSPRIKLFVFGIGVNAHVDSVRTLSEDSPKRHNESIVSLGWFFLDLRTPDLPERWFKLQNSPFGGEVLVSSAFLPVDFGRNQATPPSVQQVATVSQPTIAVPTHRMNPFSSTTHSSHADCLRFGDHNGSDIYLVSVVIQSASNLLSVVRSAVESKDAERAALTAGFWLSYSLFDVVVQTDVFFNLETAEFAPIRDSFRIMSCDQDMRALLQAQRVLSIYLCTHERVLASVDLPFNSLLEQTHPLGMELTSSSSSTGRHSLPNSTQATSVDGTFPFRDSSDSGVSATFSIAWVEKARQIAGDVHESKKDSEELRRGETVVDTTSRERSQPRPTKTTVLLSLKVSHVKLSTAMLTRYAEKESIELEVLVGEQAVRCPIRFNCFTAAHALGECPDLTLDVADSELETLSVSCFSSSTDHLIASVASETEAKTARRRHDDGNGEQQRLTLSLFHGGDNRRVGECVLQYTAKTTATAMMASSTRNNVPEEVRSIPGLSHTYRVCIQFEALRDFESDRPIVISYTNPFTGKEQVASSFLSVVKKAEVKLRDVYCLFVLYRDEASLKDAMDLPIIMDVSLALPDGAVFSTKEDGASHWKDAHEGSSSVNGDRPATVAHHSIKSCSIYVPVVSAATHEGGKGISAAAVGASSRRVGAVQLGAYIEDMGPMSEEQVRMAEEMRVSRIIHVHERRIQIEKDVADTRVSQPSVTGSLPSVTSAIASHRPRNAVSNDDDLLGEDGGVIDASPVAAGAFSIGTQKEVDELKAQLLNERTAWLRDQKLQQVQWKKRISDSEKASMDELEEEWARREEERSALLKAAQVEYQKLEQKLRATLADVETRERKLALAESALDRDQRMLREDMELLRKRLHSEQSHSVSLAQKQVDALEKRIVELQGHLQVAEKRALELETDFAEYRKQQRKVPETKLREEISSLKGHITELEKQKLVEMRAREDAEANVSKMKNQLEKMAKLVQLEKKINETRVVEELEQLRLKYIAREERYVLDGDRDELRAIKKQLDDLRRVHVSGTGRQQSDADAGHNSNNHQPQHYKSRGKPMSPVSPDKTGGRGSWGSENGGRMSQSHQAAGGGGRRHTTRRKEEAVALHKKDKELQRLERERDSLLASGTYDNDSYLVRELERRIVLRQDQLEQN